MDFDEFVKLWKEPIKFEVEILEVASACRAQHEKGQTFTFDWNTPKGICGESFAGMYPILFALRTGGDMQMLGSPNRNSRVYTCPSRVVKFRITAWEQCPLCGSKEELECSPFSVGTSLMNLKVCPECRRIHG
ncbi:MAG: TIGR04076 family protein [Theionarchaea archaeon]|nr:TIGR04076 family protein [Theionarchaea archaeon]MBU7036853.1 TIGR04076 family protein [Theionarchaea archaeon]